MTELQGWVLIALIAGIAGWVLSADVASMESKSDRVLRLHCELMARIDQRSCG